MGMFDDLIPGAEGGGQAAPDKPIRFMDEPTGLEKVLSGVSLPKWMDNLRGTAPVRVLQGMADPAIGVMQQAANLLPDSTGVPGVVNKRVGELERDYESQRRAMGSEDTDWVRMGGNVASPLNLLIATRAPMAVTTAGRAAQGAKIGAVTSAAMPVADTQDSFWGEKLGQAGAGAAGGALLTPVLGKVGEIAIRRLMRENPASIAARSSVETDAAINAALKDLGQTIHDIPTAQLDALRTHMATSLQAGKQVDPVALARRADFDALGIEPTLGQITRDPMQFARERSLRGVENVGEPLMARFQTQGNKLAERINGPAAGAKDAYNAGTQLTESLRNTDETLRRHVSGLYGEARASAGKDLDVPLQGLAQDYARVLEDFGDKVPGAIRSKFAALGLDPSVPSNQRALFTPEKADHLLKVINFHVGADPATNRALTGLRESVKGAVTSADATGGPFAPAVRAAAERFKLHEAVPALRAAAEGEAPDRFVERFIVGGKTNEVKGLANVLKQADPEAHQEARAQIADTLRRAAFGDNAAGDGAFRPAAYMGAIRRLGVDKIGAFFNAQEVGDILRVGRVGSYINSAPNAAAVNSSNTAGAVVNLLARTPGVSQMVAVGKNAADTVKNKATVRNSLAALIEERAAPLRPRELNYLRFLLSGGAAGGGTFTGDLGRE
jgi:hypothetical protein